MSKKVIFVHGYTSSSTENWYPNISKELDKLGVDYSIRDFPGGEYPHSKEWLEILDREIHSTDKPTILVGHSLGTRAILLYLNKTEKVFDAVILIAPPGNNVEKWEKYSEGRVADFFEHKIDLSNIQSRAKKFIVVHSKDDSDVPYEEGVEIAQGLNAKLITLEGRDHMSAPENYTYVLDVLKTVL